MIPASAKAPRQSAIAASLAAARVRASATPRRIAGRSLPMAVAKVTSLPSRRATARVERNRCQARGPGTDFPSAQAPSRCPSRSRYSSWHPPARPEADRMTAAQRCGFPAARIRKPPLPAGRCRPNTRVGGSAKPSIDPWPTPLRPTPARDAATTGLPWPARPARSGSWPISPRPAWCPQEGRAVPCWATWSIRRPRRLRRSCCSGPGAALQDRRGDSAGTWRRRPSWGSAAT